MTTGTRSDRAHVHGRRARWLGECSGEAQQYLTITRYSSGTMFPSWLVTLIWLLSVRPSGSVQLPSLRKKEGAPPSPEKEAK